jgi:hypothetical protein
MSRICLSARWRRTYRPPSRPDSGRRETEFGVTGKGSIRVKRTGVLRKLRRMIASRSYASCESSGEALETSCNRPQPGARSGYIGPNS